jgi:tetratricopeptide (TPR) repeat protein
MNQDRDEALALKASAKSARDDGNWREAIHYLDKALDLLRNDLPSDPALTPSRLASELADTYGIVGGVERRWGLSATGVDRHGHLKASVAAYDDGFRYEQLLGPREASTYNRINRLVSRVLLDPRVLLADGDPTLDFDGELRKAEAILIEQLRTMRQRDPWAYCDLGMIRLLGGEAEALNAFHELDRLRPRPPEFVYKSVLDTIESLSEVAWRIRPGLADAVTLLQRSVRHLA